FPRASCSSTSPLPSSSSWVVFDNQDQLTRRGAPAVGTRALRRISPRNDSRAGTGDTSYRSPPSNRAGEGRDGGGRSDRSPLSGQPTLHGSPLSGSAIISRAVATIRRSLPDTRQEPTLRRVGESGSRPQETRLLAKSPWGHQDKSNRARF